MDCIRPSTAANDGRRQRARRFVADTAIDGRDAEKELEALRTHPYHCDPMLDLPWMPFEEMPYDGEAPPHVVALAKKRRPERPR